MLGFSCCVDKRGLGGWGTRVLFARKLFGGSWGFGSQSRPACGVCPALEGGAVSGWGVVSFSSPRPNSNLAGFQIQYLPREQVTSVLM